MKASIRVNSLTLGGSGPKTLSAMEAHGKRLDRSGQSRKVRDIDPLVYGSLDLRDAYDAHVSGAKTNAGLKRPILHALIQYPVQMALSPKTERAMLDHAVRFIEQTHGGQAVFSARLDRDERGQHTVDVFYAPKFLKITKSKDPETWISTSKHGKELAEKHQDLILARHPEAKGKLTGPRHVGIALQEELYLYLAGAGLKLEPRKLKENSTPDRVDPETFQARKDAQKDADLALLDRNQQADILNRLKLREDDIVVRETILDRRERALDRRDADIQRREGVLDRIEGLIKTHIGAAAERLGVNRTLDAILGAIIRARDALSPPHPISQVPSAPPEDPSEESGPRL